MIFKIVISSLNKKIDHPRNVARALEHLAAELDGRFSWDYDKLEKSNGVIKASDGSIVGTWELETE